MLILLKNRSKRKYIRQTNIIEKTCLSKARSDQPLLDAALMEHYTDL